MRDGPVCSMWDSKVYGSITSICLFVGLSICLTVVPCCLSACFLLACFACGIDGLAWSFYT